MVPGPLRGTGRLRFLLGGLNGLALVILLSFFGIVINELHAYLEEPTDNLHWNLTQLELDLVRFNAAVDLALHVPEAGLGDVRQKFDLLYSRSNTLTSGSMFTRLGLSEIVAPMIKRVSGFITATTATIDSADVSLRAALPAIASEGEALRLDLRTMEVEVIDLYAKYGDERRAGLVRLLTRAAWASGGMIALLSILLLIMLRMNRHAELRTQEMSRLSSRLQATVATSLDAVIVADNAGRILDFNSAAERIFGYDRDFAVGKDLGDLLVPPHLVAAHHAGMERLSKGGASKVVNAGRIQMQAMRRGGETFDVEMSIASNAGPDGTIFISFLRDISQRLAADAALRAARDDALAAEKAKTNFLAVMSHEMRTPLNGVMAAIELVRQEVQEPRLMRFLDIARSSAEILLRHVKDVLEISKADAGELSLIEEQLEIVPLVTSMIEMMRPAANAKSNRIDLQVMSEFPPLRGDGFRLGQVLQNLLSNANKFTEGGTISVEVELVERAAETVTLELRVTDTGIGIAADDLERVFEDFVMLDPSYGREVGGTGLGLAISRRLIEAMGGEIGVESELDEGSCFWLRIPLRLVQVAKPAPVVAPAVATGAALDLLVVEDNPTNRILLEEMLRRLGHRVTLAEDGAEGVKRARSHRFDAILMDVSMPVMDGLTAARLIRTEGRSRASRIVAVTAHSLPEETQRFHAAGMDDALAKPISQNDLIRALGQVPPAPAKLDEPAWVPGLNPARIAELTGAMGPEGLNRALARFSLDMQAVMARLNAGAADAPMSDLLAAFHEGAGASAMVGAEALHSAFLSGESSCRQADRSAAMAAVARCNQEWQSLAAAIPHLNPVLAPIP